MTSDGGQDARPTWGFKKSTGDLVICRAPIGGRRGFGFKASLGYKSIMTPRKLAKECDRILESKKFRDYPGAKNGLQVSHNKPVKKVGWAVDADIESIRKAGKEKVDFLIVHHGIFWGNSALDRKMRARRIREAKRLGVAIYSSHLPLDAHPELGNSIGLLRALGLEKWRRKRFGKAMGKEIGLMVEGGRMSLWELANRVALLRSVHTERVGSFAGYKNIKGVKVGRYESVKVVGGGPRICRRIGIVTGGFGDLDQVMKARLDTLITGEADYPTEVKAKELGINLILGGHRETETFGVKELSQKIGLGRINKMLRRLPQG
jgi:dinuclear metal center YbgI/SA1388 family protein